MTIHGHLPDRELLGELIRELDTAALYELVEVCDEWLVRRTGARWSTLLLVDYGQTVLEPTGHDPYRTPRCAHGRVA